jgi:hypothetical protein
MKKNPKIKMKSGAEFDALTKNRGWYCYLTQSGAVKKIKRGYNKRFRQNGKDEIKSSGEEL